MKSGLKMMETSTVSFGCFDEGNLVILFNGFQKKSQKTPQGEIDKAKRIMNEYFESKNKKGE